MTMLYGEPPIDIGTPVRLAGGLWRLSLPMRANPGHVNSYLLDDGEGLVVVDSGHNTDETRAIWTQVLAGPLARQGVRAVLLTHTHPDHVGCAAWLAQQTGAPVLVAPAEQDVLDRLWRGSIKQADAVTAFFRNWGIPEDQCLNILGMLKFFRHGCPPLDCRVAPLRAGARLRAGGRTWKLVAGQGHTAENIMLLAEAGEWLISGDQVLPAIYPNISVWWGGATDPLGDYLAALDAHARLDVSRVAPAHGPVFGDLPGRIDEIRRFHVRRMARALAFCEGEPRTAYESIATVVNKPSVSPVIALIAGQVLATMACLEAQGLLVRVAEAPLRFRSTPGALAALRARHTLVDSVEEDAAEAAADAH